MFKRQTLIAWITLLAISLMPLSALAQTQIKLHPNKYSIQDDIKLGRQAAQEAESQFPLLRDEQVRGYVESVGHLGDRVLNEDEFRCVGRREIADWWQGCVLASAALGVTRGRARGFSDDAIAV